VTSARMTSSQTLNFKSHQNTMDVPAASGRRY
jgi:hypothetical protein